MENVLICGVVYSVVILILCIVFQSMSGVINNGIKWGLGPRDSANDHTTLQGRANRTVANHIESMLMFVPLALAAHAMGLEGDMIKKAVWLYLGSRAVYPFTYWTGLSYVRTIVWTIGVVGTLMLLFQILTAG